MRHIVKTGKSTDIPVAYQDIPLFEGISEEDLKTLLFCMQAYEKAYKKDEILIMDQEDVHYIGIVLTGIVYMMKEDVWGNRTLLTYMQPGELVGENFAVQEAARSYVTFTAGADTVLLLIPAHNIIHTCPRECGFHARIVTNLFHLLGKKSVALMERIEISSKASLRDKILAYLSLQAQKQDTTYIRSPLSRTQLAEYLGVNRSAMTRELAHMKEDGIIDFDRNTFVLKNLS